jgi:uncharacterized protein YndB with AHSA1/START domain
LIFRKVFALSNIGTECGSTLRSRKKEREAEVETIDIRMHFRAPIEKVWELLSDHEGYVFIKEVSLAKLLQEGRDHRNGVGAVRKVRLQGVTFVEDIVTFDPPRCLEYRVKKCTIPIRHEIGRMEFTPVGDGTDLHWTSRFELPLPLVGKMLEPLLCRSTSKAFLSALEQARARLEA